MHGSEINHYLYVVCDGLQGFYVPHLDTVVIYLPILPSNIRKYDDCMTIIMFFIEAKF